MKEEWRPVNLSGYENLYEVSNTGKVRSVSRCVIRSRIHGMSRKLDIHTANYASKELKPYCINKETGMVKYHLHKRYKSGYYGQLDIYVYAEELVRGAFPELYRKEE